MQKAWWWFLALAVAPVFVGLDNPIQDVDPAQYADVARRILESGNWLDLRDLGGPFVNKPPMMMWAQALFMAVFGVGPFAARLPTVWYGALALLGTFWVGRQLRDARLGAIAAAFVASSAAFHLMVADPKVDMPLMAFTTLAIAATLASRQNPRWVWAAWVFAAFAMLSKGPIGVVLPMMAVGPEVIRQSWKPGVSWVRRVLSVRPGWGLLIVAAITSPFYVSLALHVGKEAVHYMLWRQNVGRLDGSSGYKDSSSPLFFTHTALWAFLPFVPLTLAALLRRATAFFKDRTLPGDPTRITVWWLIVPFILISSSANKLPQYLYWLTPAAALLAADEVLRLTDATTRRWVKAGWVFAALGVIAATLSMIFIFPASAWWVVAMVAVPLIVASATQSLDGPERVVFSAVSAVAVLFVFIHGHLLPSLLVYQPYETIAEVVRREEPDQTLTPFCGMGPSHALAFYARRDTHYLAPESLLDLVQRTGPRLVVFGQLIPLATFEGFGLTLTPVARYEMYPTSRARWSFLNRFTRNSAVMHVDLMRVSLTTTPP